LSGTSRLCLFKVFARLFQKAAPIQRAERWSRLARRETSHTGGVVAPTATPWCVCGVFLLLAFLLRLFCQKKSGERFKITSCRERGTPTCVVLASPVAKHSPPKVPPSFGYAEIHPFVALSNDKEFRRLRAATNAPRVGLAPPFEKGGRKL